MASLSILNSSTPQAGSVSSSGAEPLFAVPFQPSPAKLAFILDRLCEHRPWFPDALWADPEVRRAAARGRLAEAFASGCIWEVYRSDAILGIINVDAITPQTDAQCHFVFFDRTLADKFPLCRSLMRWTFDAFQLHALRVEIPTHVRPLLKFVRRLGFRYEAEGREPSWPKLTDDWASFELLDEKAATIGSRKHQTMLYEGEWRDSLLLSITRTEFDAQSISESKSESPPAPSTTPELPTEP